MSSIIPILFYLLFCILSQCVLIRFFSLHSSSILWHQLSSTTFLLKESSIVFCSLEVFFYSFLSKKFKSGRINGEACPKSLRNKRYATQLIKAAALIKYQKKNKARNNAIIFPLSRDSMCESATNDSFLQQRWLLNITESLQNLIQKTIYITFQACLGFNKIWWIKLKVAETIFLVMLFTSIKFCRYNFDDLQTEAARKSNANTRAHTQISPR